MRLLPIVPFVLALVAFILGFLCIFAGNKTDFMQDYAVLTLNISRIGQDLSVSNLFDRRQFLDSLSDLGDDIKDSASEVTDDVQEAIEGKVGNITDTVKGEVQELANDAAASIASGLGLRDFYTVHIMNYCQGYYTPGPVKNETVDDISKNVTSCKDPSAMFAFDPTEALVANLNETGQLSEDRANQILSAINWPESLEDGLDDLKAVFKAQFVLYCIAIGFTFFTMLSCVFWFLKDGRLGPLTNIIFATLAFLFMGIASAIGTAIAVKGANTINKYGNRIGIEGQRGNGFLGLTWAATGCLFVAAIAGCLGCFGVRKRTTKPYNGEKP